MLIELEKKKMKIMNDIKVQADKKNYDSILITNESEYERTITFLLEVFKKCFTNEDLISQNLSTEQEEILMKFARQEVDIVMNKGIKPTSYFRFFKSYKSIFLKHINYQDTSHDAIDVVCWLNYSFDQIEIMMLDVWFKKAKEKRMTMQEKLIALDPKQKYLSLFESIPIPILLLDKDLKLENMNLKAVELLSDNFESDGGVKRKRTILELMKTNYSTYFEYDFSAFMNNSEIGNDYFVTSIEVDERKCNYSVEIMKMYGVDGLSCGIVILFTLMREVIYT
jgi:PAS domain-containing protein